MTGYGPLFHNTSKVLDCKNNPYFNLPAKLEKAMYKLEICKVGFANVLETGAASVAAAG